MKVMQKVNRQVSVEDHEVDKYLADGWCEVVLAKATPKSTRKRAEPEKTTKQQGDTP